MHCPDCMRPTYYPPRDVPDAAKITRANAPAGSYRAVHKDGTCASCREKRDVRNGLPPKSQRRGAGFLHPNHRTTPETLRRARYDYLAVIQSRRNRGVPEDGFDPATLETRGTTCYRG